MNSCNVLIYDTIHSNLCLINKASNGYRSIINGDENITILQIWMSYWQDQMIYDGVIGLNIVIG